MSDEHLDMIEIINPTQEDFSHPWGGTNHTLPAGEAVIKQRFVADHLCKHLTDREIQREDAKEVNEEGKKMKNNLNNEELREHWRKKIIIGVYQKFAEDAPMTEGEKVAKQNELLNEQQEARIKKLEEAHERTNRSGGKSVSGGGGQGKRKPGRPRKKPEADTPEKPKPPGGAVGSAKEA